ncbi:MAG: hypothetical protein M1818_004683 [Claussenomyces sp. TS43310]|nr:MAG: hypothetical protein M1818_004683 [Claussenomyces sp. TS43310]
MAVLHFVISPEAVGKFQDALLCLGKFSEAVSVEATRDQVNVNPFTLIFLVMLTICQLLFSALNSTHSAYASFSFAANKFFSKYSYAPPRANGVTKEKFSCKIYNKALIAVFKGRNGDPSRDRDTGIEKCEVNVEDEIAGVRSRFIIKMICRHGILKIYRLTFESSASMHALFDISVVRNRWEISSRTLREFIEHFGPGTEQLDIYSEAGRVTFTSYTEKVMSGNEVLKQPLHTSIAIDTLEFRQFSVEERLHIAISVKDFKAIISHASITNTAVKASYSRPSRPLQLEYNDEGMTSTFILMTIGDFRGGSTTPAASGPPIGSKRSAPRQALEASINRQPGNDSMLRRAQSSAQGAARESARSRVPRPSPPLPQPSIEANAMFFTEADDDRRWDPIGSDDEREEAIGWDATAGNVVAKAMSFTRTLQNHGSHNQSITGNAREESESMQRLPPTQRISQIRGLFDE